MRPWLVSDAVFTDQGFPCTKLTRTHRPSGRVVGLIATKLGECYSGLMQQGTANICV